MSSRALGSQLFGILCGISAALFFKTNLNIPIFFIVLFFIEVLMLTLIYWITRKYPYVP
jgi:hypothetical protein